MKINDEQLFYKRGQKKKIGSINFELNNENDAFKDFCIDNLAHPGAIWARRQV